MTTPHTKRAITGTFICSNAAVCTDMRCGHRILHSPFDECDTVKCVGLHICTEEK